MANEQRLQLFPLTTALDSSAASTTDIGSTPEATTVLTIAGCDLSALAEQYGTPLYLYDQATMDTAVGAYQQALAQYYPGGGGVTYAGKAFLCVAAAQWTQRHNLLLDCTGAGRGARADPGPRCQ